MPSRKWRKRFTGTASKYVHTLGCAETPVTNLSEFIHEVSDALDK